MSKERLKVGIVGGTGYTGVELLRLLAQHPNCELTAVTSRQEAGQGVAELFPNLRGRVALKFTDPSKARLNGCDMVFFATPNGVAMEQARQLVDDGVRIIDIAADFRIKDVALWEQWYGRKHSCPDLLAEAVYGLPEVNRERIREARVVANPGCYPTSVQLGFLPLLEAGVVDVDHLIADAKSGVSGAGRKAEVHTLLAEASDNFKAYGVPGHRHHPEIVQGLAQAAGRAVDVIFVPHLTPMIRGIHATLYARLTAKADLQALYERRYEGEPFVDVMPAGSHPDTRSVRGANFCRIAVHQPRGGDIAVVLSVIDNLVKGASGQAVQNMNIMFGLPETTGLEAARVGAVMAVQFLRTLKRKFGISAPRMSVHAHVPWYWRWLGIIAIGALVAGLGWATYDFGMEFAGFRQGEAARALARLNEEIKQRDAELAELRSKVATAERQLQIERATYGDVSKQMKSLTDENAVLREDLAFFQSLMPAGTKEAAAVSINRVRVQPETVPGEYRYRLLLVQTGQRVKEFQGNVQLVLNVEQNDRKFVVMLPPDANRNAKEYQVNFKFFQRVEGTFKVPSGAVVKTMQVRVFENGANAPKLTQMVSVS